MKSFFKFILIAIAVLIGSIYIFIIVIIVVGYLLLAPPFGCDPYEASEACDYKDKEFEGELEALLSNFIDKILIKKTRFLGRRLPLSKSNKFSLRLYKR